MCDMIRQMPDLSEYVSVKDAAELAGYAPEYVRQMARRGKVKAEKIGPAWLILRTDLLRHVEEMESLGTAKFSKTRQ